MAGDDAASALYLAPPGARSPQAQPSALIITPADPDRSAPRTLRQGIDL